MFLSQVLTPFVLLSLLTINTQWEPTHAAPSWLCGGCGSKQAVAEPVQQQIPLQKQTLAITHYISQLSEKQIIENEPDTISDSSSEVSSDNGSEVSYDSDEELTEKERRINRLEQQLNFDIMQFVLTDDLVVLNYMDNKYSKTIRNNEEVRKKIIIGLSEYIADRFLVLGNNQH
eukprot:Pgem_evm1s7360